MKTKKARIVRVSHPQLQRFRTAMRLILRAAVEKRLIKLRGDYNILQADALLSTLERDSKLDENLRERNYYSFLRSRYPLGCSFCGDRAVGEDLLYNPADKS